LLAPDSTTSFVLKKARQWGR